MPENVLIVCCKTSKLRQNSACWQYRDAWEPRELQFETKVINACGGAHPKPKAFLARANRAQKAFQKQRTLEIKERRERERSQRLMSRRTSLLRHRIPRVNKMLQRSPWQPREQERESRAGLAMTGCWASATVAQDVLSLTPVRRELGRTQ